MKVMHLKTGFLSISLLYVGDILLLHLQRTLLSGPQAEVETVGTAGRGASVETAGKGASVETVETAGRGASEETARRGASVETAGSEASVETAGRGASVETAGRGASVETAGRGTSVETVETAGRVVRKPIEPLSILLWTPWWGSPLIRGYTPLQDWGLGEGSQPFSTCQVSSCSLTTDRQARPHHHHAALLFHFWDLFQWNMSFPETRSVLQRYILFSIEPLTNCGSLTPWEFSSLASYFNLTASFRRDADLVVPYAKIEPRYTFIPARNQTKPNHSLLKNKSRNVLFVTSHCETSSDREGVARRLNRSIAIDFRGRCAARWDQRLKGKTDGARRGTLLKVDLYYFYLAFENSLCKDYVTEKFFDAMSRNVVPVVYGGANYSAIAPPHSYIDMLDFPSEEVVARYLNYLIEHPEKYLEYFWWKPYYRYMDL